MLLKDVDAQQIADWIQEYPTAFEQLSPHRRLILLMRYALPEPVKTSSIAQQLDLSRSRVNVLEKSAIKKLTRLVEIIKDRERGINSKKIYCELDHAMGQYAECVHLCQITKDLIESF